MDLPVRFQFENFEPRKGVESKLNEVLISLHSHTSPGSGCVAVIRRKNEFFHFEITLKSGFDTFQSKMVIDIRERRCRERQWQVEVVGDLAEDLFGQIHDWHSRRFAA